MINLFQGRHNRICKIFPTESGNLFHNGKLFTQFQEDKHQGADCCNKEAILLRPLLPSKTDHAQSHQSVESAAALAPKYPGT